jgi:hypothetical protein
MNIQDLGWILSVLLLLWELWNKWNTRPGFLR